MGMQRATCQALSGISSLKHMLKSLKSWELLTRSSITKRHKASKERDTGEAGGVL